MIVIQRLFCHINSIVGCFVQIVNHLKCSSVIILKRIKINAHQTCDCNSSQANNCIIQFSVTRFLAIVQNKYLHLWLWVFGYEDYLYKNKKKQLLYANLTGVDLFNFISKTVYFQWAIVHYCYHLTANMTHHEFKANQNLWNFGMKTKSLLELEKRVTCCE